MEKLKKKWPLWLGVGAFVLGTHYLMIVIAQIMLSGSFSFSGLGDLIINRLTQPGDAPRYLDIAENGYTATGENAINLVFYPLFPYLMRAVGLLTGSLPVAGMLISQVGYAAASILLYELILLDGDQRNAWDGVMLMAFYPFSMFGMGVFSEGLFLCLTIGCLYAIRKANYIAAGLLGFLSALTRTQGMLLLFPAVCDWVMRKVGEEKRKARASDLFLALIPLSFCCYLLINYLLHGNCFQFLIFEANAPWYQSTKWISENIAQHYQMAQSNPGLAWVIYMAQLILYFGVLFILFLGLRQKANLIYVLYGGVYLGFSYLSGWMISGGRYMFACVPVYLILSRLKDGIPRKALLMGSAALYFCYSLFYLKGFAIM